MSLTKERIEQLSKQYLTAEGQDMLDERMVDNDSRSAQIMLLGAFDMLWKNGELSDEQAGTLCKELEISPEESSGLRQANGKF
jgi:hypothetical protein